MIHFTIHDGGNKWSRRSWLYREKWSHSSFCSQRFFLLFYFACSESPCTRLSLRGSILCVRFFVILLLLLKIMTNVTLNCWIFYFQTTRYKVIIMRLAILLVLFTLVASGYARFFCKYFYSVIICYFMIKLIIFITATNCGNIISHASWNRSLTWNLYLSTQ